MPDSGFLVLSGPVILVSELHLQFVESCYLDTTLRATAVLRRLLTLCIVELALEFLFLLLDVGFRLRLSLEDCVFYFLLKLVSFGILELGPVAYTSLSSLVALLR